MSECLDISVEWIVERLRKENAFPAEKALLSLVGVVRLQALLLSESLFFLDDLLGFLFHLVSVVLADLKSLLLLAFGTHVLIPGEYCTYIHPFPSLENQSNNGAQLEELILCSSHG